MTLRLVRFGSRSALDLQRGAQLTIRLAVSSESRALDSDTVNFRSLASCATVQST